MGEVIDHPGMLEADIDIPPARILEIAQRTKLSDVVICGWNEETGLLYYNASMASAPEALWLLEQAKLHLLNVAKTEEE